MRSNRFSLRSACRPPTGFLRSESLEVETIPNEIGVQSRPVVETKQSWPFADWDGKGGFDGLVEGYP